MGTTYCSSQFVYYSVCPRGNGGSFWCSFLYAYNDASERNITWQDLLSLKTKSRGPWIIIGDYNCNFSPEDRIGEVVRTQEYATLLNSITNCGM